MGADSAANALPRAIDIRVSNMVEELRAQSPTSAFTWPPSADATQQTAVDWIALPERIVGCLGRARALELLDRTAERVGEGGRRLQEEYGEWRVARSDRGLEQVDITTETSDYWGLLAAYAPEETLSAIGDFAGEEQADVALVYGDVDPLHEAATPAARACGFEKTMLSGGASPYNTGERAITCMVHPTNSMGALLALAGGRDDATTNS